MSDKDRPPQLLPPSDAAQSLVNSEEDMTNHIDQIASSAEHVNGGGGGVKPAVGELYRQDSSESFDPKPKSAFKITSVTLHPQKGSSQDGRHSFGEEDEESAVDDSLVQTDVEESPAPLNNFSEIVKQQHQQTPLHRQDRVDSTSRFKVVKIQKREPYNVGRWRISDFMSESVLHSSKITPEVNNTVKHSESGNSSRASSTHYVHGVDDPSKNPLASINISTNPALPSIQQSPQAQTGLLSAAIELSNGSPINECLNPPHPPSDTASATVNSTTGGQATGHATDSAQTNKDSVLDTANNGTVGDSTPATSNTGSKAVSHDLQSNAASLTATNSQPTVQTGAPTTNHQPQQQQPQTPKTLVSVVDQSATVQQVPNQVVPSQTTPQNLSADAGRTTAVPSTSSPPGSSTESQSAANLESEEQAAAPAAAEDVETVVDVPPRDRSIVDSVPGAQQEISPGGVEELAANLTELVDPSATADGDRAEDADAAATGIAIDNKIEQAMDLVKSHLMLAVREEVEDLKLQIKQLIERNNQLEQENQLLRSSAAPETIAQLAVLSRQQNH